MPLRRFTEAGSVHHLPTSLLYSLLECDFQSFKYVVVVVVVNSLRPEASSLKGTYTLFALSIAYIVVIVSISKGKAVPAAKTSLAHTLFLECFLLSLSYILLKALTYMLCLGRFLFVVVVFSRKVITHPSVTPDPSRVHS
jgi:hypothetical protein